MYALIEGNLYGLKQVAYSLRNDSNVSFAAGELALMCEEAYELRDNGRVRTTKAKLRFESNFRFSFDVYIRATGIPFQLDLGTEGWNALRSTIKVRDRLMHPKQYEKMEVNRKEAMTMARASLWFNDLMQTLLDLTSKQLPHLPDWF